MLEIANISIIAAFGAGMVSFVSPCVLPLVPGYVSYIAGGVGAEQMAARKLHALTLSGTFVVGFSTVFILLGAGISMLGELLLSYRYELNIAGGLIVAMFGLFMLGLVRPGWLMQDLRLHPQLHGGRHGPAFLMGLAFAFGWTPCIGPILGSILTLSATSQHVSSAVGLLAIYSLGLGVPFLLAALFTEQLTNRLRSIGRVGLWLHRAAGLALIAMGLAMATGWLTTFSYWLLDAFPVLGTIG